MWEQTIRLAVNVNSRLRLKNWIPPGIRARLRQWILNQAVARAADRRYLEDVILPSLGSRAFERVIFVGCEPYTQRYGSHFALSGSEYWTMDIQPEHQIWGEPGRHLVGDVREVDKTLPLSSFDVVLLNGVFGFGVNDAPGMSQTLRALHRVLKPGGLLLIGWNADLVMNPTGLPICGQLYEPAAGLTLPEFKSFPGTTHCFQFLTAQKEGDEDSSGR